MEQEVNNLEKNQTNALTAFITAIIGFVFATSVVLCVPGLVCSIISLAFNKKVEEVINRPYHFFLKFSRPVAIVSIVLSATIILIVSIVLTVLGINAIINNANKAQ